MCRVSFLTLFASLWALKFVNLEFFGRLVAGRKRYNRILWWIRGVFIATFVASVISTLAECRPFQGYWTVTPDPGPQCRQASAQLITVATSSAITDLLLVVFPVPIIASSQLKLTRKVVLILLFCLAVANVVVSLYRVPRVLAEAGYQSTRTTWASVEILVATFVANSLALGSFVRDTGPKKARFKPYAGGSGMGSGIGSSGTRSAQRGPPTVDIERGRPKTVSEEDEITASRETSSDAGSSPRKREKSRSRRTASRDSLIPRGHGHVPAFSLENANVVMKTTTIQVTVSELGERPRPATPMGIRPTERSKPASSRGKERGSTLVLRDMEALPGQVPLSAESSSATLRD